MVAVLIGAMGEDFVELGATEFFEVADVGGGDFGDVFIVVGSGEVETVDDSLFAEVGDDLGEGPGGDVYAVGDGFEFDFVAGEVVVIGDAGVEFGDSGAELGNFYGDGGELDAAVVEFVGEPFFDGGGF